MENIDRLKLPYTKVLVPAEGYDFSADTRLLIPFTNGSKIGFVNHEGAVVAEPQYTMYYGDCYSESDLIRVAVDNLYGFKRSGGEVAAYKRPLFGLINSKGETLLEPSFYSLAAPIGGSKKRYTARNEHYKYGVIDPDGTEVVPFGKYTWIDGFDHGLARVIEEDAKSGKKWGLIDEDGKEVLPLEYDYIWGFYGKNRLSAEVVKRGKGGFWGEVNFSELLKSEKVQTEEPHDDCYSDDDCGASYDEFAGLYAQDVAGYSDEDIYDAFDGDPDAYWNID